MYNLVTPELSIESAKALKADMDASSYFVFAAKYTPFANTSDDVIPVPTFTHNSTVNVYNNMIFGKRIKSNDTSLMIKRYDWLPGTVYDQYSNNVDLSNKKFFVLVTEGTNYNVYKCLSNNNSAASNVQPFGIESEPFETPEDGYMWKYMYTISDFEMRRFATRDYIPLIENSQETIPGTIDSMQVEFGGLGYNNYTLGTFNQSSDIFVNGNTFLYALDNNASSINKFYANCNIKITSGLAVNEHRLITDYFIADGKRIIAVDEPFSQQVRATDSYEIYPQVFVYDTGNSATVTSVGRAIVDSTSGNTIHSVEILNRGKDYRSAIALIQPDATAGVSANSVIIPVVSPLEGHGANNERELFANYLGISTSFIGNTSIYTTENDFRTIGLVKNPLYANVQISIVPEDTVGSFTIGEEVLRYKEYPLRGTVTLNANSIVTTTNVDFISTFNANDDVLITNGSEIQYAKVLIVSDKLHIDRVPNFTSANCNISKLQTSEMGTITNLSSTRLSLSSALPSEFQFTSKVLGNSSSATSTFDTTSYPAVVNGRPLDSFNSFLQLTRLVGVLNTDQSFVQDESVTQNGEVSFAPDAVVHSIVENGDGTYTLYLINVNRNFTTTEQGGTGLIVGNTSGAQFTAQYKYSGELVPDSGSIVYLENINAVSRSTSQTETIKLILEC